MADESKRVLTSTWDTYEILIDKAAKTHNAEEAVLYSQAAKNVADALCVMKSCCSTKISHESSMNQLDMGRQR